MSFPRRQARTIENVSTACRDGRALPSNPQPPAWLLPVLPGWYAPNAVDQSIFSLWILNLGFVSDFGFRVSGFGFGYVELLA
jgi:hypothetical protein